MKTAIVTGGAGGIGAATVKKLCASGYSVAIHYNTSEESAKALSSDLRQAGYDAFPVQADLTKSEEASAMVNAVLERNGRIDVLVNNAGIQQQKLFDTVTDAEWRQMLDADLSAAFYCCRAVLPAMVKAKSGRIVNVASMWGETGAACEVPYSAAKAGVIGLTKALAKEAAPSGVTVNCVSPGAVDTAMMRAYPPETVEALCGEIPLGRLAKPEEIAEAIGFFAENAAYITGQVLGVNGGLVI